MAHNHFSDMQDDLPWDDRKRRARNAIADQRPDWVADDDNKMRGRLNDQSDVLRFMEAGNAQLTIVSKASKERFTFKFVKPEDVERRMLWVHLLRGPVNTTDFSFVGTLYFNEGVWQLRQSVKSKVGPDAPSWKALVWFTQKLCTKPDVLFTQAEIWHEGRCGRCGRTLTVPESIRTGYGPDCIHLVMEGK